MRHSWLLVIAALILPSASFAQTYLPRLGVGVKLSSLGIGIEAATAVTTRSNVRGSFNFFNYGRTLREDGIDFGGQLKLRSVQVMYDQYVIGGFHVSPGLLLGNNLGFATAVVPAGQTFSLGGFTYFSSATNPVTGDATMDFRDIAPMLLIGFGNLLPRSDRHFGVNFDVGVAFQGSPHLRLDLPGTACLTSPTTNCLNTTDPTVQSRIRSQEIKLIDDFNPFRYYPIVSLGVSWKF